MLDIVEGYVKSTNKNTRFNNGRSGYKWFDAFKKRYQSELSIKKARNSDLYTGKGTESADLVCTRMF